MSEADHAGRSGGRAGGPTSAGRPPASPGKHTRTEQAHGAAVQLPASPDRGTRDRGPVEPEPSSRSTAPAGRGLSELFGRRPPGETTATVGSTSDRLPAALRTPMEAMSGVDLDDVRVHRNSARPAQLGALAFAQGPDIHLGPAQERSLPHEAWHVVQQKQGRVAAAVQFGGLPGNGDPALEQEADEMGARALDASPIEPSAAVARAPSSGAGREPIIQRRRDGSSAQGGGDDRAAKLARLVDRLPAPLQPAVRGVLDGMRQGALVVTSQQGDELWQLLTHLVADPMLGGPPQPALPGPPGQGPAGPMIALSQVLGAIIGRDVTAFLGGHDLWISPAWFASHPIVINGAPGAALGGGALVPWQPGAMPGGGPAPSDASPDGDAGELLAALHQLDLPPIEITVLRDLDLSALGIPRRRDRGPRRAGPGPRASGALVPYRPAGRAGLSGVPEDIVDYFRINHGYLRRHRTRLSLAIASLVAARGKRTLAERATTGLASQPVAPAEAPAFVGALRDRWPVSVPDAQRAAQIFAASRGNADHARAWLLHRKPQAASQAPNARPAAGAPAGQAAGTPATQYPLDTVLGPGRHVQLRNLAGQHGRPYSVAMFLTCARALSGSLLDPRQIAGLLSDIISNVATEPEAQRAVMIATMMRSSAVPVGVIRSFLTDHTALAVDGDNLRALTCPGLRADGLIARDGVTSAGLAAALTAMQSLDDDGKCHLLTSEFPATAGLSPARLAARLESFLQGGIPLHDPTQPTDVSRELTVLERGMKQRKLSPAVCELVRAAFRLLPQATVKQMLDFLSITAVKQTLTATGTANAARILQLFALHRSPPPAYTSSQVTVGAAPSARTVVITPEIIHHIYERHSFESFDFAQIKDQNTFFNPPTAVSEVVVQIHRILNATRGRWDNGVVQQIGAVQFVIRRSGDGSYRITQYFYSVGAGINVARGVLEAIDRQFPFR